MLVICVSLSGAALPKSASANNVPYHTIKSKSYANILPTYRSRASIKPVYVWNNNLTQKRYNMKNSPNANWYVTKSYKMTNGKRTGIFYRIENPGKTITGLVWRGYLSRQQGLTISQQILNALPGTIHDNHFQKIINNLSNTGDGDEQGEYLKKKLGNQYGNLKEIAVLGNKLNLKALRSGKISFNAYLQRAIKNGIINSPDFQDNHYTVNNFTSWRIAFWMYDKNSKAYGAGGIFLLKR